MRDPPSYAFRLVLSSSVQAHSLYPAVRSGQLQRTPVAPRACVRVGSMTSPSKFSANFSLACHFLTCQRSANKDRAHAIGRITTFRLELLAAMPMLLPKRAERYPLRCPEISITQAVSGYCSKNFCSMAYAPRSQTMHPFIVSRFSEGQG